MHVTKRLLSTLSHASSHAQNSLAYLTLIPCSHMRETTRCLRGLLSAWRTAHTGGRQVRNAFKITHESHAAPSLHTNTQSGCLMKQQCLHQKIKAAMPLSMEWRSSLHASLLEKRNTNSSQPVCVTCSTGLVGHEGVWCTHAWIIALAQQEMPVT